MTIIVWRLRPSRADRSKRLSGARPDRSRAGWLMAVAAVFVGAGASALVAGCGRDDDRVAQTPAADAGAMLPGTRASSGAADMGGRAAALSSQAGAGAQRFDTAGASAEPRAPGALLPPVIHTAD